MKNIILYSLLSIVMTGCCLGNCGPAHGELQIQLFDTVTGEDMFFNGILDSDSIEVTNIDGNVADFEFFSSDEVEFSWISINEIEQGNYEYIITVGTDTEIMINCEFIYGGNKCCPSSSTNLIQVEDYFYERTNYSIRYKIWID